MGWATCFKTYSLLKNAGGAVLQELVNESQGQGSRSDPGGTPERCLALAATAAQRAGLVERAGTGAAAEVKRDTAP